MRRWFIWALAVGLAGCGGTSRGPYRSATDAVQAFDAAMKKGDTAAAARCFDFERFARANNEDWDQIPSGQRKLILDKMRQDKAQELRQTAPLYQNEGYTIGPEHPDEGDTTRVTLWSVRGAVGHMAIYCVNTPEGWKITTTDPWQR